MYRYSNGQIRLSDFKQPMGMNLKESNRWVQKAMVIPWNEIEYPKHMKKSNELIRIRPYRYEHYAGWLPIMKSQPYKSHPRNL